MQVRSLFRSKVSDADVQPLYDHLVADCGKIGAADLSLEEELLDAIGGCASPPPTGARRVLEPAGRLGGEDGIHGVASSSSLAAPSASAQAPAACSTSGPAAAAGGLRQRIAATFSASGGKVPPQPGVAAPEQHSSRPPLTSVTTGTPSTADPPPLQPADSSSTPAWGFGLLKGPIMQTVQNKMMMRTPASASASQLVIETTAVPPAAPAPDDALRRPSSSSGVAAAASGDIGTGQNDPPSRPIRGAMMSFIDKVKEKALPAASNL